MNEMAGEAWLRSKGKRHEDLALTVLMSHLAIPAIVVAAGAVKLNEGADPFFIHERLGSGDKSFKIIKVRTLPKNFEHSPGIAGHMHPEATKLGRFLRKMRIDEAPQFLNIARGDMSVVGPRPLMQQEFDKAREFLETPDYKEWRRARQIAKPGLIDLFAIRYYRDEFANEADQLWQMRAAAEIEYTETATRSLDHKIMLESGKLALSFLRTRSSNE